MFRAILRHARWSVIPAALIALGACRSTEPAPVEQVTMPNQPLYLCCNIRTESDWLTDGNFFVGRLIPAGTPVTLKGTARGVANIEIEGRAYRLGHEYGARIESFQQFLNRMLITSDPNRAISSYPAAEANAIRSGRIARGFTREQVLLALGHPPSHANTTLQAPEWTYWYNRYVRYVVQFDGQGRVRDVNANEGVKNAVLAR